MSSVISNRDRDCFSCRMVSGSGLVGIGGYLAYHAKRNPTTAGKVTIFSLALDATLLVACLIGTCLFLIKRFGLMTVFASLGVARCGQFYPFDGSTRNL